MIITRWLEKLMNELPFYIFYQFVFLPDHRLIYRFLERRRVCFYALYMSALHKSSCLYLLRKYKQHPNYGTTVLQTSGKYYEVHWTRTGFILLHCVI